MKAMLTGFAAIILVAILASVVLDNMGYSSQSKNAGNAVRLDMVK